VIAAQGIGFVHLSAGKGDMVAMEHAMNGVSVAIRDPVAGGRQRLGRGLRGEILHRVEQLLGRDPRVAVAGVRNVGVAREDLFRGRSGRRSGAPQAHRHEG